MAQPDDGDREHIYHRDGDERERKREVEIARGRTEQWHRIRAMADHDRPNARDSPDQFEKSTNMKIVNTSGKYFSDSFLSPTPNP